MEAKEFIELLGDHDKVKSQSVEELKKLSLEFPYSQPVQLLYTIRLGHSSEYLFNRQLGKTAALTNDRTVLFDLFEREEETVVETSPAPPVVRTLRSEPEVSKAEEEIPNEDLGRLKHTVLSSVTEEESQREETSAAVTPEESSSEDQSLKDKVKAILEENRRLREKYEGSQKENSAINQRISEIKERLDKIKGKQEEISEQPEARTEEVTTTPVTPVEATKSQESTPQEVTEDKDVYSADEEALLEERMSESTAESAAELMAETETEQEPQEANKESVFTIDDDAGDEELPFSAWIQRLNEPPAKTESKAEEKEEVSQPGEPDSPDPEPEVEDSDKPEPEERPALTAKFELFDSFVEKLPELKRRKPENVMNRRQEEDLSEEESSLVTETLAKVYVKQKHYDKAIKAYEILRLKYPEKSGFFADRIFEIKKLSNS